MAYAWIIDVDHIAEPGHKPGTNMNASGVAGPRNVRPELEAKLASGAGRGFQMRDSDGELYYTGRIVFSDDDDDNELFAPLDDFGRPNAGASDIEYIDAAGEWETL
jgi:hypothetical protein